MKINNFRSNITTGLAVAAVAMMSIWTGSASAADLRVAHSSNPGQSVYLFWDEFAKRVNKRAGGELVLKVFPSWQLGGDEQLQQPSGPCHLLACWIFHRGPKPRQQKHHYWCRRKPLWHCILACPHLRLWHCVLGQPCLRRQGTAEYWQHCLLHTELSGRDAEEDLASMLRMLDF